MRGIVRSTVQALLRRRQPIVFGGLTSTRPVSSYFGRERGTPVDRYYIERFVAERRHRIRGEVLEIGDDLYTRRFGREVSRCHVLHATEGNPKATMVADLTSVGDLPAGIANCIVCTQTLMFIYDFHAAVRGLYKLLKPNGVLLATVSGCSQISLDDDATWGDYFRFSPSAAERIFSGLFGAANVDVQVFGNVAAAIALLQGVVLEDLPDRAILDVQHEQYPLIVGVEAVKRGPADNHT